MPTCTDNCKFKTLNLQAHHDYPIPKRLHCVLTGTAVKRIPKDCDNYEEEKRDCSTCDKQRTMRCPNSSECAVLPDKPYYFPKEEPLTKPPEMD